MKPPICCKQEARYVVQSINLEYWYCDECKQEPAATVTHPVLEVVGGSPEDELEPFDYEFDAFFYNNSKVDVSSLVKGIP
jgi:hypothetical protein